MNGDPHFAVGLFLGQVNGRGSSGWSQHVYGITATLAGVELVAEGTPPRWPWRHGPLRAMRPSGSCWQDGSLRPAVEDFQLRRITRFDANRRISRYLVRFQVERAAEGGRQFFRAFRRRPGAAAPFLPASCSSQRVADAGFLSYSARRDGGPMLDISAIVLTIVVAVLAVLLWRLVRAIERREAQFDRRDEQFSRRDQQFEQALREMHELTAAVRKLVDLILTRWGTPPGAPAE